MVRTRQSTQQDPEPQVVGFVGWELVARGTLDEVVAACRLASAQRPNQRTAFFDDVSGHAVEAPVAPTATRSPSEGVSPIVRSAPAAEREASDATGPQRKRGPGRPRLGVVSREVSLLPRHWEWLSAQRGGTSATLRRVIDAARKADGGTTERRRTIDAAHRFLWDIAGDLPCFEELTRALYAEQFQRVADLSCSWPTGVRQQLLRFVDRAAAGTLVRGPEPFEGSKVDSLSPQ